MKFVTKKDISFRIALWLPVLILVVLTAIRPDYFIISVTLFVLVLTSWFWFGTYYRIRKDKILKVYSGPFIKRIPIERIKSVRSIKTIGSWASLSLDRLEISYGKFSKEVVSPKDKTKFIEALLKVNPEIKVEEEETVKDLP